MIPKMKANYEMPFTELGYSKEYQQFLFDRLGLRFSKIERCAIYKSSQMSVNDLINHMLDLIDVLEYEIDKLNYELEQHQKQIKGEKMSKADKMFEELGYRKETRYPYIYYIHESFVISFLDGKIKEYQRHTRTITTIEEHLAIHEKMKELGWIE